MMTILESIGHSFLILIFSPSEQVPLILYGSLQECESKKKKGQDIPVPLRPLGLR
jgi:hypothetical protein